MKLLSIGKPFSYKGLDIHSIDTHALSTLSTLTPYHYIIIHGGDGTIRRVLKHLHTHYTELPPFILNPTGSFNVIAKLYRVPTLDSLLAMLALGKEPHTQTHTFYQMNEEVFLFSAGNMGDLQHIFLSETLRFGWLRQGITKYLLATLFLLPVHLIMTPFMLMSKTRFFIFTPLHFIPKFGTFYGSVKKIDIDLNNTYNMLELDGDLVIIKERYLHIREAGTLHIVGNA